MIFDNVPDELKLLNQWINWKSEVADDDSGRTTKKPYQSRKKSSLASTTNPATWTTFEMAVRRIEEHGDMDGIGFVFTDNDPYIGIDGDNVVDGDPYGIAALIDATGTYAEISPSGDGIHVIGKGKLPEAKGKHPVGIGVFDHARYFTFTGNVLDGEIRPIMDIQSEIDRLWPIWFANSTEKEHVPVPEVAWFASDDEVFAKLQAEKGAEKFLSLWNGDTSGHGSDVSAADLALLSKITFYTQDRDQINRIFSRSALGQRSKWRDRQDYRELTMTKALMRSEFYSPPTNSSEGFTVIRGGFTSEGVQKPDIVTFNTTDIGNSLRIAHHYGDSVRYSHKTKQWYIWNGRRWRSDEDAGIVRVARSIPLLIREEAAQIDNEDMKKSLVKHAVASEAGSKIKSMVELAQSETPLIIRNEHLDASPTLFNCANGTIDLTTGTFRAHDRNDYITMMAPTRYRADAECPNWLRFLDTIFGGDKDLIAFIQRAVGYSMTGDTTERAMFMLYGSGRNGKSTFTESISRIMGDYATTSSAEMITARKGDSGMATDLARLMGVRFTFAAETGESSRMDEAKVKNITGGDTIVAEMKYRDPFTYVPQFKIWLSTNHRPNVNGIDEGIWDRIRLIPFSVRIPDHSVDRYLRDKLMRESSGILNWMIEGAVAWQSQGIGTSYIVESATREYRDTMDDIGAFIDECLVTDPLGRITAAELYEIYEKWAKTSGQYILSKPKLSQKMSDRGIPSQRVTRRKVTVFTGVREPAASEIVTSRTAGIDIVQHSHNA